MRHIEKTMQPKRRTISIQRDVRVEPALSNNKAKIVHAIEGHVWTRFVAEVDGKVLCTEDRVERTEEVAFEEGKRELLTQNRKARAEYAIDWLFDGSYYVSVQVEYDTGDHSGSSSGAIFPTREECVEYFLRRSRRHFGGDRSFPELQHEARKQMQELLEPSLFGFIEPCPVPS